LAGSKEYVDDATTGQGKDDAKDNDLGNWNMFLHKDGWMKQGRWIEKANNLESGEMREMDSEFEDHDNDCNPWRSGHGMFRGINKQHVEPHHGNCPGSVEQWYYAAAVVISLAKD
jgi:hypothetical protein